MNQTHKAIPGECIGRTLEDMENPFHNLACEYVRDNARRIVAALDYEPDPGYGYCLWKEDDRLHVGRGYCFRIIDILNTRMHEPVFSAGENRFCFPLFTDVRFSYTVRSFVHGERQILNQTPYPDQKAITRAMDREELWDNNNPGETGEWITHSDKGEYFFNVHVAQVSVGKMIRQLTLLRKYHNLAEDAGVATCFPLRESEVTTIRQNGFHHIYLGNHFQDWARNEEEMAPVGGIDPHIGVYVM